MPVASTLARSVGGGSYAFAKFLAAVGPLPPHPGGSRFSVPKLFGCDAELLLLGAMTVARVNGGWPAGDRFDDAARKARDRGIKVPLINILRRQLGLSYTELKVVAETLAESIAREGLPRNRSLPSFDDADVVARGLALAIELLGGERPSSDVWDVATRPFRKRGVPHLTKTMRAFPSWREAWAHVEKLRLDAGVQANQRPQYRTASEVARGIAVAEDALGYRPTPNRWTDDVRHLKRMLGHGVIPNSHPRAPTCLSSAPLVVRCGGVAARVRAEGTACLPGPLFLHFRYSA